MAPPLLLHSLSEFRALIGACLQVAGARTIVEIGSEAGVLTRELADFAAQRGGTLHCVEPAPAHELERLDERAPHFNLIRDRSPWALEGIEACDAYVVDGDHNYWTVSAELRHIDERAQAAERPALAFLHDVGWPCARRDQYYAPAALPDGAVLPHTFDRGVVPGSSEPVDGGFRGEGSFARAAEEGGPRNGVLTAVEDFLSEREDLRYVHVPAIFGLGVIFSRQAPYAGLLEAFLTPYDRNAVLEAMERNRLALYLEVINQQDHVSELALRQNRLLVEYERALTAVEAEASALRLERARA